MPKKSTSNRNKKRIILAARYRPERDRLKEVIKDPKVSQQERWNAVLQLQELPRDSSRSRCRNRCRICNRPRSVTKKTGLCRMHQRILVLKGMIPGMHKASW